MEIRIDKDTLPADGQKVRFKMFSGDWAEGIYTEEDQMFCVGFSDTTSDFHFAWYVYEWEPLN